MTPAPTPWSGFRLRQPESHPLSWLSRCGGLAVAGLLMVAAGLRAGPVEQVIVVFKTHFDIGYTDLASNVVQRYRTTMIDQALEVVERNRALPAEQQFVWTLPGWPMSKIAEDWPGQLPERRGRVLQALREGRFAVHALPFTTHTEMLEPEDLVRGLGYASRLTRAVGLSLPRDAKMTDVPCHTWLLPTLLRHAGVEFLHLGCNAASASPRVPRLFWWQGPDGSRLLTMYTAESYGTGLVPPTDWPCKTWLALIHTGDNHGPPTPEEVGRLLAEAREKLPGLRVRIGRLSDFADAVLAEKPELPVIRGDMPDTWIHGPMCDPAGARLARKLRPQLDDAFTLHHLLGLWKVSAPDVSARLEAAAEASLLYGEHTWGGALSWIGNYDSGRALEYGAVWKSRRERGDFRRIESSWAEHTAYAERLRDQLRPALDAQLKALGEAVKTDGPRIIVYNPLPWSRRGLVEVAADPGTFPAVRAAEGGPVLPVQALGGRLQFMAADLPPLGYRTYLPATRPDRPSRSFILGGTRGFANRFFRVELDPARCAIRSLVDARSGREWVDPAADTRLGQYLYERFDRDQVAAYVKAYVKITANWATNELGKPNLPPADQVPYRRASPTEGVLRFEDSAVGRSAIMESPPGPNLPHGVTCRVTLYRDLPFLDLDVTIHHKAADPWPEAGWIAFPLQARAPRFRIGRPGSIIDPATDIVPGANPHWFSVGTGVAVTDGGRDGLALCALDSPLVSLDRPGGWLYEPGWMPRRPVIYVNLFNNQWTTNFRLWNEGTWTSRVRLWSERGKWDDATLVVPALEARHPLLAAAVAGPAGTAPLEQSGPEVDRPGALLSSFQANPAGPGHLLRIWDQAGRGGDCTVRLPSTLLAQSAQPLNLRGEPLGTPVPVRRNRFRTDLAAFAPATFALAPRASAASDTPRATASPPDTSPGDLPRRILDDSALSDVLDRARNLLRSGFNAGSGYREVWIRDFATFIELSCQVRPHDEIKDNLRLFLRLQGDDGNIIDGFVHQSQANVSYRYLKKPGVPDFWGHKNTVETDQESSLVQAVRTYVRVTGDTAFLDEVVDGQSVLARLEAALDYLRQHRWSEAHGLLWGATTVDWGDVQPEHPWGVELDDSSHRAIDIYDNAMFLLAIRDYLELAGPLAGNAARWRQIADDVRQNVRLHLWDADRQKFIPHRYLEGSPFPPDLDEAAIWYHGGTAVAIQAGLLTPAEVRAALRQMRANVKAARAGTIGLTVYPPYPAGTFKNTGMGPWSYQNGGDWDWFGGRMIQALIEQGLVDDAYTELRPMLARIQKHNGFHEWWDRDNAPQGSGTFRGAAGVLGKAILRLQAWARSRSGVNQ